MGCDRGTLRDGKGALQVAGRIVTEFKKLKREGDVIGMLADLDSRAVAFDLNGEFQGAVKLPDEGPMWVITHLDTPRDCVELRKRYLQEAPPAYLEAMKSKLLDVAGAPHIYPWRYSHSEPAVWQDPRSDSEDLQSDFEDMQSDSEDM